MTIAELIQELQNRNTPRATVVIYNPECRSRDDEYPEVTKTRLLTDGRIELVAGLQ